MNQAIAIAAVSGIAVASNAQNINIAFTKTIAGIGEAVNVLVSWTGAPLAQYDILLTPTIPGSVGNITGISVLGGDGDDFYDADPFGNVGPNTVNDAIPNPGITNTGTTLNVGQSVLPLNAPHASDLTDAAGDAAAELPPAFAALVQGIGNVDADPSALFSFTITTGDNAPFRLGSDFFTVSEGERATDGIATFRSGFDPVTGVSSFTAYDTITVNGLPIPTPSSLALLGLGGFTVMRRRR